MSQVSLRCNDPQFHNSLPQDDVFTAKIRHIESPAEIYLTDVSETAFHGKVLQIVSFISLPDEHLLRNNAIRRSYGSLL